MMTVYLSLVPALAKARQADLLRAAGVRTKA